MKAPKLLKNESSTSFKARVAAWEKRTGKKYPKTFRGITNEERILGGAIQNRGLNILRDYSKDYNLDDEVKEFSLDPSNSKKWRESKEGKAFAKQELMIQQNIDDTAKEQSTFDAYINTYGDQLSTASVEDLTAQIYEKKKKKDNIPEEDVTSDEEDETSLKNQVSGDKPKNESKASGELGREEWLKKTANSPAAKAFGKGKKADDLRWAAQQNYRKFKKDNNRGRLGIGLFGL